MNKGNRQVIGPFPNLGRRKGVRYIITVVKYVTKWAEAEPIKTCTRKVATKSIYKNIVTRFGCPLTIIGDRGTHFVDKTKAILLKEFMINHQKSITYHPQSNGVVESFNKTLTKGLK